MSPPAIITEEVFCTYLKCKYKAYLKIQGTVGEVSEYERLLARIAAEYRKTAGRELLPTQGEALIADKLLSLSDTIQSRKELILNVSINSDDASCHVDALYLRREIEG